MEPSDVATMTPKMAVAGAERLPTIDILRAIAAFSVVLYHARPEFWLGFRQVYSIYGWHTIRPDIWLSYASAIFSLGWMGVPIFFILSGYCIHRSFASKLARNPRATLPVGVFYLRRSLRIYPVYVAALLLTALVDHVTTAQAGLTPSSNQSLGTLGLNLVMAQELFVQSFGSNGVFWTLSIEFHLYLFYPALFLVFRRYGPQAALGFAAAVSLLTAILYAGFDLRHYTHARADSPFFTSYLFLWTAGAYLAEIHAGRAAMPKGRSWLLLWLIAFGVGVVLEERMIYAWSPLFLAVGTFGFVDVVFRGLNRWVRRKPFGMPFVHLVGVASYSLYATHVPFFHAVKFATNYYRSDSIAWPLLCAFGAIGFALLFFYCIERYTIRASARANTILAAS